MKRFGFGQRLMESRILTEVEEMLSEVRQKRGRAFDVTQLTMSCTANVIASMLFGHRFDHGDAAFQQLISDIHYLSSSFFVALHLFPALRFLPHFKTSVAKHSRALGNNLDFINNNIAACNQVRNRGVTTGGILVYIPPPQKKKKKISLPYKFLGGYWLFFSL